MTSETITKTVTEVPKHFGSFISKVVVSIVSTLVIGYFFQDFFRNNTDGDVKPTPAAAVVETGREAARARLQSGLDLLEEGEYGPALAQMEQALEIDSTYGVAWSSISAAYLQLQNFPEAVKASRKAIEIDGANDGAYYNLGFALSEQGQLEEAIEAFDKATQINVGFTRAYSVWGDLLIEAGRPDDALVVLERGRKTPEVNYHFLINKNIGKAYMALTQYSEAIEYLELSLQQQPWPESNWLLGQAYESAGRKADAKAQYEEYVNVESDPKKRIRARDRLAEL